MPTVLNKPRRRRIIIIIIILKTMMKDAVEANDVDRMAAITNLTVMLETQLEGLMGSATWTTEQEAAWSKIEEIETGVRDDCATGDLETLADDLSGLLEAI